MSDFPDLPLRLLIASTPAHLPVVRAALERLCELMGFDEPTRDGIVLAVDEALTNVIRHAYGLAGDQPIEVTLRRVSGPGGDVLLEIDLRDWGEPAEPGRIRSRDLEDVRPGGLGVHIMQNYMDEIDYAPAPGGGTRLKMIKKLPARSDT
jgi:anti-sigma regulatory factor (Ser/Thr protein kinase)